MSGCIYIYIDEAGNFDFSPKGSRYFILTCVVARAPFSHVEPLYKLKCDCLGNGFNQQKCKDSFRFHASEDTQETRNYVFDIISNHTQPFAIYSAILRKNKIRPQVRSASDLYQKVFSWLIGYIFSTEHICPDERIVIVTDLLPVQKKQNALKRSLKKYLKMRASKTGGQYRIYHHRSESDINLQVADYCCWAIQRKWERGDVRSYEHIKSFIGGESDLLEQSQEEYYPHV